MLRVTARNRQHFSREDRRAGTRRRRSRQAARAVVDRTQEGQPVPAESQQRTDANRQMMRNGREGLRKNGGEEENERENAEGLETVRGRGIQTLTVGRGGALGGTRSTGPLGLSLGGGAFAAYHRRRKQ
eukprot:3635346-Rhodomonas_salina.1